MNCIFNHIFLQVISTVWPVSVIQTAGICPSTLCISLFSLIEYRHPQLPNLFLDPPHPHPPSPSFSLPLVLAFTGDSQSAACSCPHRTIVEHKPIVSPNLIIPAVTADAHVSYSGSLCSVRPYAIFVLHISPLLSLISFPSIFTLPIRSPCSILIWFTFIWALCPMSLSHLTNNCNSVLSIFQHFYCLLLHLLSGQCDLQHQKGKQILFSSFLISRIANCKFHVCVVPQCRGSHACLTFKDHVPV